MASTRQFNVYSARSLRLAHDFLDDLFEEHGEFKITITTGKKASMPQLALFNIWVRQFAARLLGKAERDLTNGEVEGMKRSIKRRYYQETHEAFMVETITDPFHPDRSRLEVTSSGDWRQDEISRVMEWLQAVAANEHDLVLESIGEYQRLRQQANT